MTLKRFHETMNQKWGQNPVRPKVEAGNLAAVKRGIALAAQAPALCSAGLGLFE